MSDWSTLELHFLNVGHGDCTIICHPNDHRDTGKGRISFVDINDWKHLKQDDSKGVAGLEYYLNNFKSKETGKSMSEEEYAENYLDDPVEYYESEYRHRDTDIWRFIVTHPDMDHLSGIKRLHEGVGFSVMWDTYHNKEMQEDEDEWPDKYSKEDWETYQEIRDSDTGVNRVRPKVNSYSNWWRKENGKGDSIRVLHPSKEFVSDFEEENQDKDNPEYNNLSYVLKIYHGDISILLSGDAEKEAWDKIIDRFGKQIFEDVDIFKASHHGRDDGYHEKVVEAMNPEHVIISVGKKPSTDAQYKYRQAFDEDTEIWSTRQYGRIKIRILNSPRRNRIQDVDLAVPEGIFDLPD